jgi:FMN phosphatase YigB (HAD superfamily)
MITTIMFDLGNVLLHFNHRLIEERLRPFASHENADSGVNRIKELAAAFERGHIDSDAFINESLTVMQAVESMDRDTFMSMWNEIFWINEPLAAMLPALASRARLVLLSNTNPLHIEFVRKTFPQMFAPFSVEMFSYELHAMKPETRMYEMALSSAGAEPEECLFFDDIHQHVASAASLGIHAYQYVSVQGVRDILSVYELLPDPAPIQPTNSNSYSDKG